MKQAFILLLTIASVILPRAIHAQSGPHEQHIDSLWQSSLYEEAYQYAKHRWQSLPADKSQEFKDATAEYYGTTYMLEMFYRFQENFAEALKLNEEMLDLMKPETDYYAIRNKIVCYSGMGQYADAAKNRALLYKAHKKDKLPCEYELCHYFNFDFFKVDTLNVWGYEWYDELPKDRFSTSFTKVVYYVYNTHPDGSDKDQLYRLHLIMFHGTDMPFDYIMEKCISTEKGEWQGSMYEYTYKENIDYEKLHNDVREIVKGDKKTDTQRGSRFKNIENVYPDSAGTPAGPVLARQKTEYVDEEPYKEFNLYGPYKQLEMEISLKGAVKSVMETGVLKKDNASEYSPANQQTWKFSPTGLMSRFMVTTPPRTDIHGHDSTDTIAFYVFDSDGRLHHVIEEYYNSENSFEYDENGHLAKVSTHYWDDKLFLEKEITLNDEGKPVRVEERRNGKKLTVDTYCYDERGNKVAHLTDNRDDAFVYDDQNNMIFEGDCKRYKNCNCKGFKASQGYEYDDQHRLIRKYSIDDWKPSGWDTYYQYDSAGREIEYKHYDVRGTQKTFDRHIQTTYDSAGRIVKKEALLGNYLLNDALFYYSMVVMEEFAYDEQGNLVEHVAYKKKDQPYKIVRYQFEYDSHGNWVKRVRSEGTDEQSLVVMRIQERQIEYYE